MSRIASEREAFAGRKMVILFHSQESKHLIPVRCGTVIGFESIGPMVLLRFRVGEFPRLALPVEEYSRSAPQVIAPALESLRSLGKNFIGPVGGADNYDWGKALPNGYYVREACHDFFAGDWDGGKDASAWARLAAILHDEPNLSGIPLFYLLGFKRETGSSVQPQAIENRFSRTRESICGFSLVESERYRLRVLEWSEPPPEAQQSPVKVRCEYNADRLALEGASDLVVGRYDIIEFTFSARQSGYSEIGLRAEPLTKMGDLSGNGGGPNPDLLKWSQWPSIFVARVPVVVRRRPMRILLALAMGAAGLWLYLFFAPGLAGERTKALAELVALGLLLGGARGLSEFLSGTLKLGAELNKLRGGPAS